MILAGTRVLGWESWWLGSETMMTVSTYGRSSHGSLRHEAVGETFSSGSESLIKEVSLAGLALY